ncbi:MAG: hypothetical protein RJB11_815 [Planctomycetota bacterium]
MRLFLAIRAFFGILFNRHVAQGVRDVMTLESSTKRDSSGRSKRSAKKSTLTIPATPGLGKSYYSSSRGKPDEAKESDSGSNGKSSSRTTCRSEAINLLALLQRRAGLVDLIYEDLEGLSDEQIGKMARDVLDATHKCLEECLQVTTIVDQEEGDLIEIPDAASPNRWNLVGDISSERGRLLHPGWIASTLELPGWRGSQENALVIAPVKVDTAAPIRLKDSATQN